MTPLSAQNSPLPQLCANYGTLIPYVKERLDQGLFPHLDRRVPVYFWDTVALLEKILRELPLAHKELTNHQRVRDDILGHTRDLMNQIAGLTEFFGDFLMQVLPHTGKKNKVASSVKARLESIVNSKFKIPINLVKHEHFKLYWLERSKGSEITSGFMKLAPTKVNK